MVRCFLSALAGTVVAFIWSAFSWIILPWHNWEIKSFSQGGQVITQAITQEATEHGIYLLPNMEPDLHHDIAKQKKWQEQAQRGPYVYMTVNPKGLHWDMGTAMLTQFIIQFLTAAFAVCLLGRTQLCHILTKASFVSLSVTLGAFLMAASSWNWWGFHWRTILINVPDVAIGWFLAGLAIAAITKNNPTYTSPIIP